MFNLTIFRIDEAEVVVQKIAKWNKKDIPANFIHQMVRGIYQLLCTPDGERVIKANFIHQMVRGIYQPTLYT